MEAEKVKRKQRTIKWILMCCIRSLLQCGICVQGSIGGTVLCRRWWGFKYFRKLETAACSRLWASENKSSLVHSKSRVTLICVFAFGSSVLSLNFLHLCRRTFVRGVVLQNSLNVCIVVFTSCRRFNSWECRFVFLNHSICNTSWTHRSKRPYRTPNIARLARISWIEDECGVLWATVLSKVGCVEAFWIKRCSQVALFSSFLVFLCPENDFCAQFYDKECWGWGERHLITCKRMFKSAQAVILARITQFNQL